jgi:chorismate synthase
MSDGDCDIKTKQITLPRPGHADLSGMMKFEQDDARNILERASARETAIRVAAGSVFKQYLSALGVEIGGRIIEVNGVKDGGRYSFTELKEAKNRGLGIIDEKIERLAEEAVSSLKEEGDTAGGVAEIRVRGLKSGFGSCMTYTDKLDARLARELMSIQAVKGVEVGEGFEAAKKKGSEAHDEIFFENGRFTRKTNRAGGIEGGMSNGEEIVLRVAMKPIPTLMRGLKTVDYLTRREGTAATERSDVCAIFALEVIAEAAVAKVLAEVVSERLGGDVMRQVKERYDLLA